MKFLKNSREPRSSIARQMRRGFTLVEILMAIMVLAFGITGSLTAMRIGFDMVETARDQTMVAQVLQSEIETLRLMAWREISELPEEENFTIDSEFDATIGDRFTCIRRVQDVRSGVEIKDITLLVKWKTTNGVQRELSYKTRIARNGLNDYYSRSL